MKDGSCTCTLCTGEVVLRWVKSKSLPESSPPLFAACTTLYISYTAPLTPHCSTRSVPIYSRYALPTFPSPCPQTLPPYPLQPHPNTPRLAPPAAHPPLHFHPTHHPLRWQHLYPPHHFTTTDLQVYARYEEQRGVESEQSEIAKRGGGRGREVEAVSQAVREGV